MLTFLTGPQRISKVSSEVCGFLCYANGLTVNISPPKDSRRDAKACQAKRLKINKEMQTFMKDSKSSRKAAGIPREKQQKNQVCFILRASRRIPCQGKGKSYEYCRVAKYVKKGLFFKFSKLLMLSW